MKSIIFLSDSNLDNPILHKQGLPLLVHLSSIGYKDINVNLQDSLWLAYRYRSEYIVNKLMVEYNEYELKAMKQTQNFLSIQFPITRSQ